MTRILTAAAVCALASTASLAQAPTSPVIEVPLAIESGRLVVPVDGPAGTSFRFVLGLSDSMLTTSGAARIGDAIPALTLGGAPVMTEAIPTVPDARFAGMQPMPDGVGGSATLRGFDIIIDAPNERLSLKPPGTSVRWEGVRRSGAVPIAVYHDEFARADVEVNGELYGGLLELTAPELVINGGVKTRSRLEDAGRTPFRMGYTTWTGIPYAVRDLPLFRGWDPEGKGFVVIGAAVARDCALAVSFTHQEIRTCVR